MKIIQIKSMPEPKIIKELYSLNQDNVPALGSLSTETELEELIKLSDTSMYIFSNKEIIGFLVCFRERSKYHSPNYIFFNNNESKFMYVDRIAIKQNNINKGLGSLLYNKLYKLAALKQLPICCEVNTIPINQISLNFHYKNNFKPVGEYDFDDHSVVYLKKEDHYLNKQQL